MEVINNDENFSNVVLGMSITAKARIHMHKFITRYINNDIKVYYTDTDSIFINKLNN